jgi:hypothetical protein
MYVPPPVATAPPLYIPPPTSAPPPGTLPPPIAVVMPPPGKVPPVIAPPPSPVTGSSGSGSSGSGVVLGPQGQIIPIVDTTVDLPDAPDAPGADHTVRNLAIAGGIAVGLYLMFRRPS